MTKDFIISTIAEIEGYPCDNMIGNVDIAEFMDEKCDKWCRKHCHENNKKKCWKKFFKEWCKAEKEKQLKLLESAGVSLETAEKVWQMSLFSGKPTEPEVKQMTFDDISNIISNIEGMNNLIERAQKNFDSEVRQNECV